MKVATFDYDKPGEDLIRYDTVKQDKSKGFTLILSNGDKMELTEKEPGVLEIMGRLGNNMHILPVSGNVITIQNIRRK